MKKMILGSLLALLGMLLVSQAHGSAIEGRSLSVVVDGAELPEYAGRGTIYVEAVRGRPYELRVSNPHPYRLAVALSVDGLNTIDARRTDSWSARKWVLEPFQTIEIPGWQVSGSAARQFFFTGEKGSYGALLGKTANLGVIEAVFFRERPAPSPEPIAPAPFSEPMGFPDRLGAAAPDPPALQRQKSRDALSDEYAGTGMGGRRDHEVVGVFLDLERQPIETIRVRYEFRAQLIALGIFPQPSDPLRRRERARGFEGYCPQPEK